MHRGLPCSKGMLGSMVLDEYCPPSTSATVASFSDKKPPTTIVPTCDDNLINDFEQDSI
jgi:hypothetical protein